MTPHCDRTGLQHLVTLFEAGTAAGLTDRQLLERFVRRGGESSERAFAVLVERHGPMVVRACRAVLRDEHETQDAFQVTFLTLARRAGTLWVRDSVAPWLHRVARRTAVRASRRAARRRAGERRAAEQSTRTGTERAWDAIEGVVHEELERLPDRYRAPVVLCDLEGRSYEEAARHVGCPVGTIRSRLARGRAQLRGRLTRRGIAPAAALAAALTGNARAAVPKGLTETTVRAVLRSGAVPATAAALNVRVWRSLLVNRVRTAAAVALSVGVALGTLAAGAGPKAPPGAPEPAGPGGEPAPPQADQAVTYAWQRTEGYEPPNFDRFFPDDPEGGRALDALWHNEQRDDRPDAEILRTVRQGLRRTEAPRGEILEWIGSRFIWQAFPQDPDAIEIVYHAADFRGDNADPYGARSGAVQQGLAMVQPKPPAVLRTLIELCMRVDNREDWHRVAWGTRPQRGELLALLTPYLSAQEPATRDKAALLAVVLRNGPDQYRVLEDLARKQARSRSGDRLPGIKKALLEGDSPARLRALEQVRGDRLCLLMDDSFAEAYRACIQDPDPAVRRAVGEGFASDSYCLDRSLKERTVDLLPRLLEDGDRGVRAAGEQWADVFLHTTFPTPPRAQREAVVRRLVKIALADDDPATIKDLPRIVSYDRDLAANALDEALRGGDAERAARARAVYQSLTRRVPRGETSPPETRAGYTKAVRDLYAYLGRVYPYFRLKGIDWEQVGRELLPRADALQTENEFCLLVMELLARVEDSHVVLHRQIDVPELPQWEPGPTCLIDDRGRPVFYDAGWWVYGAPPGVRPGMAIVSVNGVPAAEALDRWMRRQRRYQGYSSERSLRSEAARHFLRQTERGAKVALVLEDPKGRRSAVDLRADQHFQRLWVPRAPVPTQGVDENGAEVSWFLRPDGIGYVSIRVFRDSLETDLGQALASLRKAKGLIVDLRGNEGDELEKGAPFDPKTAFASFDRASTDSRRVHYQGPVALLIDEQTTGAGEESAAWFTARKRARLFGAATAGASAGEQKMYRLTDDLYQVLITVKARVSVLGRPLERTGVDPDVAVPYRAQDLAQGRDTVAEAAAEWLAGQGRQ